jgi:anthranilate synthase/aminodeoxychorismate synthase-like glutamine amidotransferase
MARIGLPMTLSVLLVDNFDSFSFNLVDELEKRAASVSVWRNDVAATEALAIALAMPAPRLVVLSPGPGSPKDAGCIVELVQLGVGQVPIFGVCLGHQAIVEAFGGEVAYAGEVVHGKPAAIEHDGSGIFAGLPSPMVAGRYHSLAARRVPPELRVTARTGDVVMAVEHRSQPVAGVQFHPESILTPHGGALMESVMRWAAAHGGVDAGA